MKVNNLLSTSTDGGLNWDILLEQYQREYDSQSKPFLLCDIFDMKENMHTNLLEQLLTFNNYMLLPSFVEEVLGIDDQPTKEFIESGDVYVTTQLKALGNKKDTWGLVDLVIGIGDTDIIIENKINGAVDVKNQLSRYVASMLFVRVTSPYNAAGQFAPDWYDALEANKKRIIDRKLQNLYVYYLTKHESDENPSHSSFSGSIKTQLETLGHFRKISYENDLYQWLKSIVLPLIPQSDLLYSAMQQYIAYLEYLLSPAANWQQQWIINTLNLTASDIPNYKLISDGIAYYQKQSKNQVTDSLIKALEFAREDIFAHDLEHVLNDWGIHYTPSFCLLYKRDWTSMDNNKYACPTIQIVIHTPFHWLSKKTKKLKVSLLITHLSPAFFQSKQNADIRNTADRLVAQLASKEDYANSNVWDAHNHIFRVVYQKNFDIQGKDFNDKEARVALYKDIIQKLASSIDKIDNALEKIEHEK